MYHHLEKKPPPVLVGKLPIEKPLIGIKVMMTPYNC